MTKQKSILEKFSDTVKSLTDSASEALKREEPARVDETSAAYMPLAADGLVSDPMMVPPIAREPARRTRRPAKKTARRGASKGAAKTASKGAPRKSARKTARKSASARSKPVTRTTKGRGAPRKSVRKGRRR